MIAILIPFILIAGCSNYENENQIAQNASDEFYLKLTNRDENDFDKYLTSISSPVQVYEKEESNLKFQENLKERINILRNIFEKIEKRDLQDIKAGAFDNETKVSTSYLLKTKGGNFYQTIVWKINRNKSKLINVLTYSYNENGEVQIIVKDGKIIL